MKPTPDVITVFLAGEKRELSMGSLKDRFLDMAREVVAADQAHAKAGAEHLRRSVALGSIMVQIKPSIPEGTIDLWLDQAGFGHRQKMHACIRLAAQFGTAHGHLNEQALDEAIAKFNSDAISRGYKCIEAGSRSVRAAETAAGMRPGRKAAPGASMTLGATAQVGEKRHVGAPTVKNHPDHVTDVDDDDDGDDGEDDTDYAEQVRGWTPEPIGDEEQDGADRQEILDAFVQKDGLSDRMLANAARLGMEITDTMRAGRDLVKVIGEQATIRAEQAAARAAMRAEQANVSQADSTTENYAAAPRRETPGAAATPTAIADGGLRIADLGSRSEIRNPKSQQLSLAAEYAMAESLRRLADRCAAGGLSVDQRARVAELLAEVDNK